MQRQFYRGELFDLLFWTVWGFGILPFTFFFTYGIKPELTTSREQWARRIKQDEDSHYQPHRKTCAFLMEEIQSGC